MKRWLVIDNTTAAWLFAVSWTAWIVPTVTPATFTCSPGVTNDEFWKTARTR